MHRFRNIKIDWLNHFIAFLSALFGIYIAFRLENFRENQQEKERIQIIEKAIRNEIENNLMIYSQNVEVLSDWLEYNTFIWDKTDDKGQLVVGINEMSKMTEKHPTRLKDCELIKTLNDTLSIYKIGEFIVDVVPMTGLSTSSWKAGIASGLLNSMDYSIVNNLTKIYDWVEKDIGINEKDFYENILGVRNKNTVFIDNLVSDYNTIVITYSFKQERIQEIYDKIEWTN